MTTARRLVTADEFLEMPDDGRKYELVRGELVEEMPPGMLHALVSGKFGHALLVWVEANGNYGYVVVGDPGFRLERGPDTVRCPDVAWIAPGRLPESIRGFGEFAPDLAVEVKSPSNTRREMAEKAAMWLSFGSREVWAADPETVAVTVYRPGAEPVTLREGDVLDGGELLPGFSRPVAYFLQR